MRDVRLKTAIVVVLAAVALLQPSTVSPWTTFGLVVFGAFNVIVNAPGSGKLRAIGAAAAFAGLLTPQTFGPVVIFIAVVFWAPAIAIAWALADEMRPEAAALRPRVALAALIAAVALASIAYRLIVAHSL